MRDNVKGGALTEVSFFVLLSVYEPRHGYAIMRFIEESTNGRLVPGAGTLYGALNALQEKGWIAPLADGELRRREYIITDSGRRIAEGELERLRNLTRIASEIICGKDEQSNG